MEKIKLDDGRITLIRGDCLEVMPKMKAGIIDLILADLPYGTTRNRWDSIIPLDKLWEQYKRVRKSNAAIVLTAQTPFDKVLGVSNLDELRYEWIWEKDAGTGHLNSRFSPMKSHENVLVFSSAAACYVKDSSKAMRYYPQMETGTPYRVTKGSLSDNYDTKWDMIVTTDNSGERYPKTVIKINRDKHKLHPTQKPVALMEYLIKTYTNEGDLVLDNTMGSGTTAVACINTGRRFVGIEKDIDDKGNSLGYFDICIQRCEEALALRDQKAAA